MRKRHVLAVLAIFLYILPLISISNSYTTTILESPNMSKEFSNSEYLDESPHSITGFSETIEEDVLFLPDGFYDDTPVTAFEGNDDWTDTFFMDSLNWSVFTDLEYCGFSGEYTIEGFDYSIYGYGTGGGGNISVWNAIEGEMIILEEIISGPAAWYNGSYFGGVHSSALRVDFFSQNNAGAISINYIEVRFHYLTGLDYSFYNVRGYDHYGTSFSNISEWNNYEGIESYSSDGDIVTLNMHSEGAEDKEGIQLSGKNIWFDSDYVVETRYIANDTIADWFGIFLYSGTTDYYLYTSSESTSYQTIKAQKDQFTLGAGSTPFTIITSIILVMRLDAGNISFSIDYFRISPANETGWQHDGSTLQGVSNDGVAGITYTKSSDGNILTQTATAKVGTANYPTNIIHFDDTSTKADIERDYYLFWCLRYRVVLNNQSGTLEGRIYSDGYLSTWNLNTDGEWHTVRINHKVQTTSSGGNTYFAYVGYTDSVGEGYSIRTDFLYAYSIAGYTLLPNSCETDDILYARGGSIVSNLDGTGGEWIALYNDLDLNVDTEIFNIFEITVSNYDPEGLDFAFRPYYHENLREFNYDTTTGDFLTNDELDNFWFYIYDSLELSAIRFIDTHHWRIVDSQNIIFDLPNWHIITSAIITFWLDISTVAVDLLFVVAGLFMIPTSTCYLAYGGRKNFSADKLIYGLLLFAFGWALLIGGIM